MEGGGTMMGMRGLMEGGGGRRSPVQHNEEATTRRRPRRGGITRSTREGILLAWSRGMGWRD